MYYVDALLFGLDQKKMVGISTTDGEYQVPVIWIISNPSLAHVLTSYASAQDVVY
jgi:hypothetical protein